MGDAISGSSVGALTPRQERNEAYASVGLQAVTSRFLSNSRAEGEGKQKIASNGEHARASQRFEKVFARSALLAYHVHLGDARYRQARSFSKLELVSRICLSISCAGQVSYLRDTDFGKRETGDLEQGNSRFEKSWMTKFDDK